MPGADAQVGGGTAIVLDTQRAAEHDNKADHPGRARWWCSLILALLLRALVAPLMLVATVVLSFVAALGISALVFKHVFGFEGADTSLPLFVFVFLVALGHRLQHLPDDARARGVEGARHPARGADRRWPRPVA